MLPTLLLAIHVLANTVWIGSLLAVALIASRAPWIADPPEAGAFARYIHVRLAVPAFVVSFLAGLSRIALAPSLYAHLPWFHAKLTFALVVIVLHHVIGARARRVAGGRVESSKGLVPLAVVALAAAAVAVFLGVSKAL